MVVGEGGGGLASEFEQQSAINLLCGQTVFVWVTLFCVSKCVAGVHGVPIVCLCVWGPLLSNERRPVRGAVGTWTVFIADLV